MAPAPTRSSRAGRHGVLPPAVGRATLAGLSEPGSVQTMCSLAACSPALKVARPYDRPWDELSLRDRRRATPRANTRHRRLRAVHLLPDGQICLLAVSDPAVLGRVPGLPAAGGRRPGHRTAEWPTGHRVQPDHANGSRAERYLAAPASTTRFSTGWHATSLTAALPPRTGPMQVIGPPVAPDPAARPSLAL